MAGKILGIVQARIGSSRLPRKVMLPLGDRTMLAQCIRRLQAATLVDEVVLATSDTEENRPLLEEAARAGVRAYAGSEMDLADRFWQAARLFEADAVVRVTADCPLVDPGVVDRLITLFRSRAGIDLATNNKPSTFPHGLDAEVISFAALDRLWRTTEPGIKREWFTLNFSAEPRQYDVVNLAHDRDLTHLRWTVDYAEDLEFVRAVFAELDRPDRIFVMDDILALLERRPELLKINAAHAGHTVTHSFDEIPDRDKKAFQ